MDTKITPTLKETLRKEIAPELPGYAALDALETLEKNWEQALHDGAKPEIIVTDLTETIAVLERIKEAAKKYLASKSNET